MTHEHDYNKEATKNLSFALALNLIFNIIVILGGIFTNSVAILTDAIHDLGDTLAIIIAWVMQKISQKKGNEKFTYGYKRFSVLGAVITSTIVICACSVVLYEAIGRIISPEVSSPEGMLIVAILGIIFKGLSVYTLHKGKTFNEKSILIHLTGDVIEWIIILILSIILFLNNYPLLDPIASILISIWIIYNLAKNLYKSLKVILQGAPDDFNIKEFKKEIQKIDGVKGISDLHIWTIDGLSHILTLKIMVSRETDLLTLSHIKYHINEIAIKYEIYDSTVEFLH